MGVETFGPFREHMDPLWEQARLLCGGTLALRKQGCEYLPRFENETDKNYQRRLTMASLTNFYVKARNQMVGEMLREDVQYKGGTIPDEFIYNLDQRGTDLTGMAEKLAEELLTKAVCGILVDHPESEGALTLADEQRMGLRHYWTFIKAESVIDLITTFEGGKETVLHLRWFEDHVVADDLEEFAFRTERQIFVLDRQVTQEEGQLRVVGKPRFRKYVSETSDRQAGDVQKDTQTTAGNNIYAVAGSYKPKGDWIDLGGFDEIPFVPFYSNRDGIWRGRPLLADIAEKNIQHWRQSSNYGNALEIGAFPVLARFGLNKTTPLSPLDKDLPASADGENIVGPHIIMDLPSTLEGADVRYLEPTGTAYEALERNLDRIISEAEIMALDLLVKQFQKTATEANYDRLQSLAPLQRVAIEIERGLTKALEITAKARKRNEKPGEAVINKDFGVSASDAIRVQALRDARAMGAITNETYLAELQSIGALSVYLDPKKEAANVKANDDDLSGRPPFGQAPAQGDDKEDDADDEEEEDAA